MLIVFQHNAPNNTLPIFWSTEDNWFPLFRRYNKVRLPRAGSDIGKIHQDSDIRRRKAVMFTAQVNSTSSGSFDMHVAIAASALVRVSSLALYTLPIP